MPLLLLLLLLFGSNLFFTDSLVYFPLFLLNFLTSLFPTMVLILVVGFIAWCFGNE